MHDPFRRGPFRRGVACRWHYGAPQRRLCRRGAARLVGNITVEDVDAAAAKVERAGGKSYCPPSDIPGVARFATVADQQGATFILFNPVPERQRQRAAPMSLGHAGWHELHAADGEAAFTFYSDHFGWTKAEALDMGQLGTYQLPPFGAMMTSPDGRPPAWLFYFVVEAIQPAIDRIRSGGGTILNGPMEVPGVAVIVQAEDPQGPCSRSSLTPSKGRPFAPRRASPTSLRVGPSNPTGSCYMSVATVAN